MIETRDRSPLSRFVGDTTITLVIRVLGLAFQVGIFALIARTHRLDVVGVYAMVNTGWMLTNILGSLGFSQTALRFVSNYLEQERPGMALAFARFSITRVAAVTIGIALLALLGTAILSFAVPSLASKALVAAIFALGLPAYALIGLYVCVLRGASKVVASQVPETLLLQALIATGVGALALLAIPGAIALVLAQATAAWLTVATYFLLWHRALPGIERDTMEIDERKRASEMARSVFGAQAVTMLSGRSSTLLIGATLGSAAAALYEAAQRFGLLADITSRTVGISLSPQIARAHARNDTQEVQNLFTLASWLQTLPALALLLFMIPFGRWLLDVVLGPGFDAAYPVLVLISLATLVNASGGVSSTFLLMSGGERTVFFYSSLKLLIVLTGFPLVAYFGGLAAAASIMILGNIARDLGMTVHVMRKTHIRPGVWSPTEIIRTLQHLPDLRHLLLALPRKPSEKPE
jgi:O-antigen/teichoic acid export membrane protein